MGLEGGVRLRVRKGEIGKAGLGLSGMGEFGWARWDIC